MTDTTHQVDAAASETAAPAKRARRGTGLSGMVLAELQQVASGLGISGTSKMRKGDLIAAIKERQGGGDAGAAGADKADGPASSNDNVGTSAPQNDAPSGRTQRPAEQQTSGREAATPRTEPATQANPPQPDRQPFESPKQDTSARNGNGAEQTSGRNGSDKRADNRTGSEGDSAAAERGGNDDKRQNRNAGDRTGGGERGNDRGANDEQRDNRGGNDDKRQNRNAGDRGGNDDSRGNDSQRGNRGNDNRNDNRGGNDNQRQNRNENRNNDRNNDRYDDDDDGNGGGRGRRRRRGRDRYRDGNSGNAGGGRGRSSRGNERYDEPQVSDDDVLVPIAGILDILDNYAFVRTSGYLTGSNDVYVSLSQVRKYSLRRGDAITGAVKAPREGERREKYNALVRLDSVNGLDVEAARNRPEFTKLTPLYPQKRLRLETEPNILTTRIIDLVMPIGKGQRALVVSPPKAGKTSVLQAIANAITTNNPECHLMVVLVDERPEEVTDMQRSVKGEVIASTFDRPPTDHTTVAELSIERAKRLVELGHDVVVLLDSITRLGRAYNLAAPTSGRILSGGVDSTALYPPKRFLGAARNIENGGSLTIIATALVETGSMMDTVIFEEFKGTGNAELKLDRRIADKRVFPAVDVDASGTRKEEILLSREELAIIIKLRRVLHALDPIEAIDLLISRMKKTANNAEFLMQIAKSTPGTDDD